MICSMSKMHKKVCLIAGILFLFSAASNLWAYVEQVPHELKKYLAIGMLRSTYFIVQPIYEKGEIKSFIFYGGGWGHGVGLCQTGSGGRANAGQNYREILNHYYTDIEIQDVRTKKPV